MQELFQILSQRIKENKPSVLITIIKTRAATPGRTGFKMLVGEEGRIFGTIGGGAVEFHAINRCKEFIKGNQYHLNETIQLMDEQLKVVKQNAAADKTKLTLPAWCGGEVELFYELYKNEKILNIFGAGHVGAAVAELAIKQGFFVEFFDDRKEVLDALPSNIYSKTNLVQYPPAELNLTIRPNSYVVILTQSHRHDLPVLEYLLNNYPELPYIGMIGSKLKVRECILTIKKKYGNKFSFENLYSPIGIEIGGTTPSEIAVSIIAEIFSVIYNKEANHMRLNYKEINP